jgi:hypothetical protein
MDVETMRAGLNWPRLFSRKIFQLSRRDDFPIFPPSQNLGIIRCEEKSSQNWRE